MAHLRKRYIQPLFDEALRFSPIVGLLGHRQVGKTTLVTGSIPNYLTLDKSSILNQAKLDPESFIEDLKKPVALDEVQLVPTLFPALKEAVRVNKKPGQFILTGSVRFSSRKIIRESLTGRINLLELYPMSISEIQGDPYFKFLSKLNIENFNSHINQLKWNKDAQKWWEKYQRHGGLPGICFLRKENWIASSFESVISTILDRDLRLLYPTSLEYSALKNFYQVLSKKQGMPIEIQEISRETQISQITVKKLLNAFEALFLIRIIPTEGDRKKKTLFLEDQGEAFHLHEGELPPLQRMTAALYANLRVEFNYQSGPQTTFSQFKKRSGTEVPLVVKREGFRIGIIPSAIENPTPKTIGAAQVFLKTYPNSIVVITHNHKKIQILNQRLAVVPASCLVMR
jgi:predicted AAA+ superfamily ATPase